MRLTGSEGRALVRCISAAVHILLANMSIHSLQRKGSDPAVLLASRHEVRSHVTSFVMSKNFVHYLRAERRRAALTQTDVAALLGGLWKGRVSLYERGAVPPTDVALAYEAILHEPVSVLLGGRYADVVSSVRSRARHLIAGVGTPANVKQARRLQTLARIAA